MTLWEQIKNAMLKNPNQSVCENDAYMTYEELVIYAEILAKKLDGEKCCAILCGSEMAAAMALLGCFAAGVTALPLSVRYGQTHCGRIIDFVDPTAIITDIDGELNVIQVKCSQYNEPDVHPALIMCTSGTTGKPKGVMLSESNILTNITDICSYFKIDKHDNILISRPIYHCAVLTGEFLTALFCGTSIRFYSGRFNPSALLNLICEKGITVFCGTPTMLDMMAKMVKAGRYIPLEKISVSGECMQYTSAEHIHSAFTRATVYHVYGLTEASPRISYLPPHLFIKFPYSVGYPLKSVSLKIIKADGSEADQGEEGILWVKGNNVMLGYFNDPELTSKVVCDGWLCTNDIAVMEPYNMLTIKGRADDMIIHGGMNIYPREIEDALKTDDRVEEVIAYRIRQKNGTDQIGLKLIGNFKDSREVTQLCVKVLSNFMMPSRIELVGELPKTISGKTKRSIKND